MTATRLRTLVGTAVVVGVLVWLAARSVEGGYPPPRPALVTLALLALAVGISAVSVRNRLAGRPRTNPILPMAVARYAALAKASSLVGAACTGAWGGLLAIALPELDKSAFVADAVTCGVGVAVSLALTGAALALERVCRVKPPGTGPGAD